MNRTRTLRRIGILLSLVMVVSLSIHAGGRAEDRSGAKEEIEITVMWAPVPKISIFESLIPEFEKETGIKVNLEVMRDYVPKIYTESVAGSGSIDVFRFSPSFKYDYISAGWVEPLDRFIERDAGAIDMGDYIGDVVALYSQEEVLSNEIYGLPFVADVWALVYRDDLFRDPDNQAAFLNRYGYELQPPDTTTQLRDIAEFFTRDTTGDGNIDMWGYAEPLSSGPSTIMAGMWIHSFGGNQVNPGSMVSTMDDPRVTEAFRFRKELQKFVSPGSYDWDWFDHLLPLAEGNVAMANIGFSAVTQLFNPDQSPYWEDFRMAPLPVYPNNNAGLTTGQGHLGGGGIAMHAHSRQKEAAWEFIKWMAGRELRYRLAMQGVLTPRTTVYSDEAVLSREPHLPVLSEAFLNVLGNQQRTPIFLGVPGTTEINQTVAVWFLEALRSMDSSVAAMRAHDEVNEILELHR